MSPEAIGTVILAIIAAVGLFGGGVAWFYKRGGQERESAIALRDNTAAIISLTTKMDGFMVRTEQKQDALEKLGNSHETRLTVAERDLLSLTKAMNGHG